MTTNFEFTRREAIMAAAGLTAISSIPFEDRPKTAMPGPYRNRVVEVGHPGAVVDGKVQQRAVSIMMARGMMSLTGMSDPASAWKKFFSPGDVVAIKGSPVGRPRSISQLETLREVVSGLLSAGVRPTDIVQYERYEEEQVEAEFEKAMPKGARLLCAAKKYDDIQVATEGYDTSVYITFPAIVKTVDDKLPVNHRSHLAEAISNHVTKVVNVAALKDHASAGITMALKNMSHGFVNNVSRSHEGPDGNSCDVFIPTVLGIKKIQEKVVLHIGDGLIGTYDGGPGKWNPHFKLWEYCALFFATDPVAMDRVGWSILDAKRAKEGLPAVAKTGKKVENPGGHEGFDRRQPEHVLIAGAAGLGECDIKKIKHTVIRLT